MPSAPLLKSFPKWRSAVILVKQEKPKKATRINIIIQINGKRTQEVPDLWFASTRDSSDCPVILALPKPETTSRSLQDQF